MWRIIEKMSYQSKFDNLNPEQQLAVRTIEGPVMVIAGPGTGKTELLSVRAAHILRETDTLPEQILCLTYTEAGATAMRERLVETIGRDAYKIPIHTFHSFGSELIAQHREYFYQGATFAPADEIAIQELLVSLFQTLRHDNPLAKIMNGEYTFLSDVRSMFSEWKRAGLTYDELQQIFAQNDETIAFAETQFGSIFGARVSLKAVPHLWTALEACKTIDTTPVHPEIPALSQLLTQSLEHALHEAEASNKPTPLTQWKNHWLVKDAATGLLVPKSRERQVKLRAAAELYKAYAEGLSARGLYDFDDMILQTVQTLENQPNLRLELQEKYLYLMVDEFQDTNLAQLRIVRALTDSEVHEGRPNILVVGDDDQAIYSFQGAELSNILEFATQYRDVTRIVLTKNYRSARAILERSREVITQGVDRLETRFPGMTKQLEAQRDTAAAIVLAEARTPHQEAAWIADQVAQRIKNGTPPKDIAVITQRHAHLKELLPFFEAKDIKVRYEHKENLLDSEPIVQLELLARITSALSRGELKVVDALLPKLLSHPAWDIPPKAIWQLGVHAYDTRRRWFDSLEAEPLLAPIHAWLLETSQRLHHTSLEEMLDRLLGRPSATPGEDEAFTSPLFEYFFSDVAQTRHAEAYILHLRSMITLREKLSRYRLGHALTIDDLLSFIDTHRQLGTALQVNGTSDEQRSDAITLMTAHASKGLEFPVVCIAGAQDNRWGEKSRSYSQKLSHPENMQQLRAAGSTQDERLRLFYVAMTRAKDELLISYSSHDAHDKPQLVASFLSDNPQLSAMPVDEPASSVEEIQLLETAWYHPLVRPSRDIAELLQSTLEHYKMSATHFHAFTNVVDGGPHQFMLNYLLRMPQAGSAQLSYGHAIHTALQKAHISVATGSPASVAELIDEFTNELSRERLDDTTLTKLLEQGRDELTAYLTARYSSFHGQQKAELDFKSQQSMLGEVHLTGSLDVATVYPKEKRVTVVDYKTGRPSLQWAGKEDYEKRKLHAYSQQLMFYKLLVEHARDYRGYTVTEGSIEFIRPTNRGDISILTTQFDDEALARFQKLVTAVWQHIQALSFPDTSGYEQNIKGILAFEDDLIEGRV